MSEKNRPEDVYIILLFNKRSHAKQMIRQVDSTNIKTIWRYLIFDCRVVLFSKTSVSTLQLADRQRWESAVPQKNSCRGQRLWGNLRRWTNLCSSFERQECWLLRCFSLTFPVPAGPCNCFRLLLGSLLNKLRSKILTCDETEFPQKHLAVLILNYCEMFLSWKPENW